MKTKFMILAASAVLAYACSPDALPEYDFSNYRVDKVVCEASSNYLVADGVSALDLNVKLYTKLDAQYTDIYGVQRDQYREIPRERWRGHDIKFFVNGQQVTPPYTTTSASPSTLQCYAEVDGMRSTQSPAKGLALYPVYDPSGEEGPGGTAPEYEADADPFYFEVKVREAYTPQARRIPVVFHVMELKNSVDKGQYLKSRAIQDLVDLMNDVYGRKHSTAPNGANPNIEFVLALRDPSGNKMMEPGINRVNIEDAEAASYQKNYVKWIWNIDKTDEGLELDEKRYKALAADGKLPVRTPRAFWNPDRYLNIWVGYENSGPSFLNLYRQSIPMVYPENVYDPAALPLQEYKKTELRILTDEQLSMWKKNPGDLRLPPESFGAKINTLYQAGLYLKTTDVPNYNSDIVRQIGAFFGLIVNGGALTTGEHYEYEKEKKVWLDDFCDDTPKHNLWYTSYKQGGMESANDGSSRVKYTVEAPYYVYRATNIMESSSAMSYVSQDQVRRMEWVLNNAPGRQMWKDNWAITK